MNRILMAGGLSGWGWLVVSLVGAFAKPASGADEFERPPISYSETTPDNRVQRLQASLNRGEQTLQHDSRFGFLPNLLKQLEIPVESQLLVFSKTSLQRNRIAPRTPRALYFNDDTYVGFCHAGDVIELSTADPLLGTVFYTLEQNPDSVLQFTRQTDKCLQCHGTSRTDNIPGHTIRSLFVDRRGLPLLSEGGSRVDHTTPIEQRWGGWYVTGTHGSQEHLGNFYVYDQNTPRPWQNTDGQNLTDVSDRFLSPNYLTPHSDLVALLVFEHQTYLHNLLTQASFTARQALFYEEEFSKAFGDAEVRRLDSTTRRIENAGEKLVEGLLFVNEAPLQGRFTGTSGYAEEFSKRGQRDSKGRSLRDFDLETRLFKYPCSYLIESPEFDALPPMMKQFVAQRIREVLAGQGGEKYNHLSETDRRNISEILAETNPDLWGP